MQTVIVSKLLSMGCLMFQGCKFSRPASSGVCNVCWKEITSRNIVKGTVIDAFLPFEFVAALSVKASQKTRLPR